MNSTQLPIDLLQILLGALQQAASTILGVLMTLPWWALLLFGLLLVFRLVRPELGITPVKNPHHRRPRRRRW